MQGLAMEREGIHSWQRSNTGLTPKLRGGMMPSEMSKVFGMAGHYPGMGRVDGDPRILRCLLGHTEKSGPYSEG